MSKQINFFIYLLESFSEYSNTDSNIILKRWDELGITDTIYDMYEIYHCERLQNAFDDILVLENQALSN